MNNFTNFTDEISKLPQETISISPTMQHFLYEFLKENSNIKQILEIGFYKGLSAATMLFAREDTFVTSFDNFLHAYTGAAKILLDKYYPGRNLLLSGNSPISLLSFFEQFSRYKPDLVFIDGGNEKPIPFLDLYFILKNTNVGTWIIINNYYKDYPVVIETVNDMINKKYIENVKIYKTEERTWAVGTRTNNPVKNYPNADKININQYLDTNVKLSNIQKTLILKHGTFNDEYPEQLMAVKYLTGNEKILEIGGNIGRNSLIIASILGEKQNNNFVSLECDTNTVGQLKENRDLNNFKFHIENSALSKRKLIQKGWETIESDILLPGYTNVNNITFNELLLKYNIIFDTLILDCEGAFYYILQDMPEILDNVRLIIMENDYSNTAQKEYVDTILRQNNFYVDYVECGPEWATCPSCFYEAWKKSIL